MNHLLDLILWYFGIGALFFVGRIVLSGGRLQKRLEDEGYTDFLTPWALAIALLLIGVFTWPLYVLGKINTLFKREP